MNETNKYQTRPPVMQDNIYRHFHEAIIAGELSAGDRLPPRIAIEKEFGVSSVTVQRAFNRLISDGFVQAHGPAGTIVAPQLPHLTRFALAFPPIANDHYSNRWFERLTECAHILKNIPGTDTVLFHEVSDQLKSSGYAALVRDVKSHRLAGILFVGHPHVSGEHLAFFAERLPCVLLGVIPEHLCLPTMMRIQLGGETQFLRKALDHLAAEQRRRVAMIVPSGMEAERLSFFHAHAHALGMETSPKWIHGIDPPFSRWGDNIARLLFDADSSKIPDALIISDDNLMDAVTQGIIATGIHVPRDVTVISHCNFPDPSKPEIPLVRLGYDTLKTLEIGLDWMRKQRHGESVPESFPVDAVFEWELET